MRLHTYLVFIARYFYNLSKTSAYYLHCSYDSIRATKPVYFCFPTVTYIRSAYSKREPVYLSLCSGSITLLHCTELLAPRQQGDHSPLLIVYRISITVLNFISLFTCGANTPSKRHIASYIDMGIIVNIIFKSYVTSITAACAPLSV